MYLYFAMIAILLLGFGAMNRCPESWKHVVEWLTDEE